MISSIVIILLLVQEIDGIIRNIPHRTSNDRYMDPCKAGWKNDFSYEKNISFTSGKILWKKTPFLQK